MRRIFGRGGARGRRTHRYSSLSRSFLEMMSQKRVMFNEKYPGKVVKLKMDKMEKKSEEIRAAVTTGK